MLQLQRLQPIPQSKLQNPVHPQVPPFQCASPSLAQFVRLVAFRALTSLQPSVVAISTNQSSISALLSPAFQNPAQMIFGHVSRIAGLDVPVQLTRSTLVRGWLFQKYPCSKRICALPLSLRAAWGYSVRIRWLCIPLVKHDNIRRYIKITITRHRNDLESAKFVLKIETRWKN